MGWRWASWAVGPSATWPTACGSGSAIDFLDPPLWPAFNVADIAIVAGVALLVLALSTRRCRLSAATELTVPGRGGGAPARCLARRGRCGQIPFAGAAGGRRRPRARRRTPRARSRFGSQGGERIEADLTAPDAPRSRSPPSQRWRGRTASADRRQAGRRRRPSGPGPSRQTLVESLAGRAGGDRGSRTSSTGSTATRRA